MSGYKNTLRDDGAISLWSFDGDNYDRVNRNLLTSPLIILDEIGNLNPGNMIVSSLSSPHGYRMGMPSLVSLETEDQSSISFGYYGKQPGTEPYPKAYIEVSHSNSYAFGTEFSIEFLFNKQNEQYINDSKGWVSFTRPIIKKAEVFNFYYNYTYSQGERIICWFPTGNSAILPFITNKTVHVIITFKIVGTSDGIFEAHENVYFDARRVYSNIKTIYDTYPLLNVSTPIEIGGISGSGGANSEDRNTSPLQLDQIAIYNKTLGLKNVSRHYKKIYEYDDMIVHDEPAQYYPFNEIDSLSDWTVYNKMGGRNGNYNGTLFNISRSRPGPVSVIPNATCAVFTGGSFDVTGSDPSGRPTGLYSPNNYSIEFWFSVSGQTSGILFTSQQACAPYHGLLIQINEIFPGQITIYESKVNDNYKITSLTNTYNDNKWHHICVQRTGTTFEAYIDGVLQERKLNLSSNSIGYLPWIHMMNGQPGNNSVNGGICKLAIYNKSLDEQQIHCRSQYAIIYKIKGIVTLQGVPTRATIRIFDHKLGNLIAEITSNINTGFYEYNLSNNKYIDLMVFSKEDSSVRYRAFGPILPAECEDIAITL